MVSIMEVRWTFTASTGRLAPRIVRELAKGSISGWAADRDDAKRRAIEIYEGRDSTEAVIVIANGPTGVEVVYRADGGQ